ncbi:MAG: hypothetical protein IPJ41_09445 [Phycisphaerales bacterium]|nr:hypothetical protein [Phycisphaerales bacterium]
MRKSVWMVAACAAPAVARGVLVYGQPTTADDTKVGLGWYSQSEPRVRKNYKHADDLMVAADAEIGRIVWWGQSSLHTYPDLTNFDSFQIEFFAGELVGGQWLPGPLVASEVLDLGATNPTETGRKTSAGAFEYRHDAELANPVALQGGQRYFLAISAGMIKNDFSSDAWQWQDADLHDGWSGVYSWATGEWSGFQDSDSAFELYSVPTPGPVLPLLGGIAMLLGRRR